MEGNPDHFHHLVTQILWAETYLFGCASVSSAEDIPQEIYKRFTLVCHWYPEGNIVDQAMYLTGRNCSKCDELNNTTRAKCYEDDVPHRNLCSKIVW